MRDRRTLEPKDALLRMLELQDVIRRPDTQESLKAAEALAMYLGRRAPTGRIANLAMQILTLIGDVRRGKIPGPALDYLKPFLERLEAEVRSVGPAA